MFEQENIVSCIMQNLSTKSENNTDYQKAKIILESLLQSSKSIPQFRASYNNDNSAMALFLFGGAFKLLIKQNLAQYGNITSLLLLLNFIFPKVNIAALKQSGIINKLQSFVFSYALAKDSNPLAVRLSFSILSYTLLSYDRNTNQDQLKQILTELFSCAVQSHRNNIVTKQSSKLLAHIITQKKQWSKILSDFTKEHLISDLQNDKNLYLFNVREVLVNFPLRLINDISYRVLKGLHNNIQTTDQTYRIQTYFFLERMIKQGSVTSATIEEIVKELSSNVPLSTDSGQILYGYMQCLSQSFTNLWQFQKQRGNKYLSSIIGIFQQFMLREGKVQLQATSLLGAILTNCLDRSLWVKSQYNQDVQLGLNMDDIQLEDGANSHNFGKVVCMMKLFLTSRFQNIKGASTILVKFFRNLDESAWNESFELINEIIVNKDKIDEKIFRVIFHAILHSMSVRKILEIYPFCLDFSIADQDFQVKSNLWILGCLEKYQGQDHISSFMTCMYPLLLSLHAKMNQQPNQIRKQAYNSLIDSFWRSFKIFCKKINKNSDYQTILKLIDKQLTNSNQNRIIPILIGLQILCKNLKQNYYQSEYSEKVISTLAKLCDLQKNYSNHILIGIRSLALISRKSYLDRVFQKNIAKLLQQKAQGTLNSPQRTKTNMKNLEILIMIGYGIDFCDPTVFTSFRLSKQELVLKLVSELLMEDNQYQKKAFKYMGQVIPLMPHSFTKQIIDIFESNKIKIRAASKISQLLLLNRIWNQLNNNDSENSIVDILEFVKRYLPDILICNKQNNKRARSQADLIFKQIYQRISDLDLNEQFIEILCAGFATHGSEIKLATLHALGLIAQSKINVQANKQILLQVLDIVLILFKQNRPEIYKAVVEYTKKYVLILQRQAQLDILPKIIEEIFNNDQSSRMDNRSIVKHFLLKMIKKHSRSIIQQMIPEKDRRILINAIKIEKSLKKKKRELKQRKRQQMKKKQHQQQSEEEDDRSEHGLKNQQQHTKMDAEPLQDLNNTDNLLLKYDLEKQKFHFVEDRLRMKNQNKDKQGEKDQDIAFTKEGMMVVHDGRRRERQDGHRQEMEEEQINQKGYQNVRKKRKVDSVHLVKESGDTFKSKRAGGDVQLKDKPQPYAFIQLNSKALNKRFKKRAEKVFDTIFQRKQGGIKGLKTRMLSNH